MKSLSNLKTLLIIAFIGVACSGNKEEQHTSSDSIETLSDTVYAAENTAVVESQEEIFSGEYLIGDGNTYIVPVGDTYEMQDGAGNASNVLYFQGKESDTLSVFSTEDKSIIFKMNPGNKYGTYFASNEQWPVELVGPVPKE